MSFLFPIYALGALAIIGPIIWHFTRSRPKTHVPFSSTFFLSASPISSKEKRRFEHWILAIIRILILLALAVAFMRPYFPESNSSTGQSSTKEAIWILVDTSASMQREGCWDSAQQEARKIVNELPKDARAFLWWFDSSPVKAQEVGSEEENIEIFQSKALGWIDEKSPGWNETRLDLALELVLEDAVQFLESLNLDESGSAQFSGRIFVISDFQTGSYLDNLNGLDWPESLKVVPRIINSSGGNGAGIQLGYPFKSIPVQNHDHLADEALEQNPKIVGDIWEGGIRVHNAIDSDSSTWTLRWEDWNQHESDSNSMTITEITSDSPLPLQLNLGQGETRALRLRIAAPKSKLIAGSFVLESESGADPDLDNRLRISLAAPALTPVRWVSDPAQPSSPERSFFIEQAFLAMEQEAEFRSMTWDEFMKVDLNEPEPGSRFNDIFWIIDGFPTNANLTDKFRKSLTDRIKSGASVCLILNHPQDTQLLALLSGSTVKVIASELESNSKGFTLTDLDFSHPWLAPFRDPATSDFSKIRFFERLALDLEPVDLDWSAVASFETNRPAWIDIQSGSGKIAILTSGFALKQSQFARSTKFLAFWNAVLRSYFPLQNPPTQIITGNTFNFEKIVQTLGLDPSVQIHSPNGAEWNAERPTVEPGLYPMADSSSSTSDHLTALAVNLDPIETQLATMPMEDLTRYGVPVEPGQSSNLNPQELADTQTVNPQKIKTKSEAVSGISGTKISNQALIWEQEQSWWKWILAFVLALILIETVLGAYWSSPMTSSRKPNAD